MGKVWLRFECGFGLHLCLQHQLFHVYHQITLMLRRGIAQTFEPRCRHFAATASRPQLISILPDATLETFQNQAFTPGVPCLLPGQFSHLPAIRTWFSTEPIESSLSLNRDYLEQFRSTIVPIEITRNGQFTRIEQPLSFFLE